MFWGVPYGGSGSSFHPPKKFAAKKPKLNIYLPLAERKAGALQASSEHTAQDLSKTNFYHIINKYLPFGKTKLSERIKKSERLVEGLFGGFKAVPAELVKRNSYSPGYARLFAEMLCFSGRSL
jgi:hypothetical protein